MGKKEDLMFHCFLAFVAGFLLSYFMNQSSNNAYDTNYDLYEGGPVDKEAVVSCAIESCTTKPQGGWYTGRSNNLTPSGGSISNGGELKNLKDITLYAYITADNKLQRLDVGERSTKNIKMDCSDVGIFDGYSSCVTDKAAIVAGLIAIPDSDADLTYICDNTACTSGRRQNATLQCGQLDLKPTKGTASHPSLVLKSMNETSFCLNMVMSHLGMTGSGDFTFTYSENQVDPTS